MKRSSCLSADQLSASPKVFTVSKDLVPRVLSKIVESVADEMCRLMQCVSSFSKNGALQVNAAVQDSHSERRSVEQPHSDPDS